MIIGYVLAAGGIALLATGLAVDATPPTAVGVLWIVLGLVDVALARAARNRARQSDPPGLAPAVDQADPAARALLLRRVTGAPLRGVLALAGAAVAIAVGWHGLDPVATLQAGPGTSGAWQIFMLAIGGIVGLLTLFGFLMYGATRADRSAVTPATVALRSFKELALTGTGGRPYLRFDLDVRPQNLPEYRATIQAVVPALTIPKLAVGVRFPARVAGPDKPRAIVVDWANPVSDVHANPAAGAADPATRLAELDSLLSRALISDDEYRRQRARILDSL